ncbi:MAG: hypothetical protein ACLU4N_23820 [Butyricimonas faecihominis]
MAKLFKRVLFHKQEVPFVMELPPYRMPTLRTTVRHMWSKGEQYLKNGRYYHVCLHTDLGFGLFSRG